MGEAVRKLKEGQPQGNIKTNIDKVKEDGTIVIKPGADKMVKPDENIIDAQQSQKND